MDILKIIQQNQALIDHLQAPLRLIEQINRHTKPVIDSLTEPLRIAEQFGLGSPIAQNLAAVLNQSSPWLRFIEDDATSSILRSAREMRRTLVLMRRKHRKFAAFVRKIKWPPPGHLPARALGQLAEAHASEKLSDAAVEELLVEAYTPIINGQIAATWDSYAWLGPRRLILQEALTNYREGRYASAVYTLVPHFEGVLASHLGKKLDQAVDVPALLEKTPLGDLASNFYLEVILVSWFPWKSSGPAPDLSRHGIVHGHTLTSGTKSHATRLILALDYFLRAIDSQMQENIPEGDAAAAGE